MNTKTIITSLFLYTDGSVEIKIKEPSGEETEFKLSKEKFTGMDMDARYAAAKQRAASYIACLEKEDMTDLRTIGQLLSQLELSLLL